MNQAMTNNEQQTPGGKKQWDISTLILIGMGLGVATGLFFGEMATGLKFIGDAFIRLLQMTVLPYVVVTIITGFGGLSAAAAKRMAINGGLFLLIFWGIGTFSVLVMTQAYPTLTSATFFSAAQITAAKDQSLVDVFVPGNFFESLAKGTVPAVVVFSIMFGAVLIKVDQKDSFMKMMETIKATFENISGFVFKLSPVGIFALTANAAGTLKVEELSRLSAHFATYIVAVSMLTVFILPWMAARLVGLRYGAVLASIRSALILAFTSGNAFVTLPLVEKAIKELYAPYPDAQEHVRDSNVVIPVVFNFPTVGTIHHLMFIFFTGWLYSKPLGIGETAQLMIVGLLNLFGGSYVTIPYLLNMFKLPSDAFELFLLARIITDMFESALDVMSIFALTVLYMGLASKMLKRDLRTLVPTAAIGGGSIVVAALVVHFLLGSSMKTVFSKEEVLRQMAITDPVPHEVFKVKRTVSGDAPKVDRLTEIKQRGVLRVGYNPNSLPFAFFNQKDELVGYDISRAHELARGIGVKVEFYPFDYATLAQDLQSGAIDLAMSSISINFQRMRDVDFTVPYMQLHVAFVVKDYLRKNFRHKKDIEELKPKIAVIRGSAYIPVIKAWMPDATLVEIDRRKDFFEGKVDADALLTTAEQGSAWSLLYPNFKVMIPEEPLGDDFVAYPIAKGNPDFARYLDTWLMMAKTGNKADAEFNYWILGKDPKLEQPRWSVIRDVLHWVK